MTAPRVIRLKLLSDTTLSRGEGTAGAVDVEIEHDLLGLPCAGGKTIRGLLRDSWLSFQARFPELHQAAMRIHGPPAEFGETGIVRVGDGRVSRDVSAWVAWSEQRERHGLDPMVVLEALTDVRYQTSEERATEASAETMLRAVRVVLRGLELDVPLTWLEAPLGDDLRCLAISILATRHIGLARNRGRGFVEMSLDGDPALTRRLAHGGPV